jgi:hypothetical protein
MQKQLYLLGDGDPSQADVLEEEGHVDQVSEVGVAADTCVSVGLQSYHE